MNTLAQPEPASCHPKKLEIRFAIDKQPFVTEQPQQTAGSLLEFFAGEKPSETTLVLKRPGHEPHKYAATDPITMVEGMHFVVFHNTPCPVS